MTHVNCFTITFGRAYVDWQRSHGNMKGTSKFYDINTDNNLIWAFKETLNWLQKGFSTDEYILN